MKQFLQLVEKERARQIFEKGYTAEHDDEHTDGSIADGAACYAANQENLWKDDYTNLHNGTQGLDLLWPWEPEYFKKQEKSRKEQIITACAMLMAEYERLERLEAKND